MYVLVLLSITRTHKYSDRLYRNCQSLSRNYFLVSWEPVFSLFFFSPFPRRLLVWKYSSPLDLFHLRYESLFTWSRWNSTPDTRLPCGLHQSTKADPGILSVTCKTRWNSRLLLLMWLVIKTERLSGLHPEETDHNFGTREAVFDDRD